MCAFKILFPYYIWLSITSTSLFSLIFSSFFLPFFNFSMLPPFHYFTKIYNPANSQPVSSKLVFHFKFSVFHEFSSFFFCLYKAHIFARFTKLQVFTNILVLFGIEKVSRNIDLVYGGGSIGLMGLISQAVYEGGRHVIGWASSWSGLVWWCYIYLICWSQLIFVLLLRAELFPRHLCQER